MGELRQDVIDAMVKHFEDQRGHPPEQMQIKDLTDYADAMLRVLVEHDDTGVWICARCDGAPETHAAGGANDECIYQPTLRRPEHVEQRVREEIEAVLLDAHMAFRTISEKSDAVMAVVASSLAAHDAAVEREQNLHQVVTEWHDRAKRAEVDLAAMEQRAIRAEQGRDKLRTSGEQHLTDLMTIADKNLARAERAEAEIQRLAAARLVLAVFGTPDDAPQPFSLCRDTKVIGLGVQWPGGAVTIKWTPPDRMATVTSTSLEDALAVADFPDGTLGVVWLSEDLGTLAEAEERAIRAEADLAAAQMQVRVRDARLNQVRALADYLDVAEFTGLDWTVDKLRAILDTPVRPAGETR
jgi:hypothetical protein